MRERIAKPIEQLEALDAVLEPLQKAVQTVVPEQSELKDVLSGTWLGEPLHPPLTDVVIGTWTSALLLDLLGGEQQQKAADGGRRRCLPQLRPSQPACPTGPNSTAAAAGSAACTRSATRRRWCCTRFPGRREDGATGPPAWLSPRWGTPSRRSPPCSAGICPSPGESGVNQTAFEDSPEQWTAVLDEDGLEEGKLTGAQADDVPVLLVRKEGRLYGLIDRCSHRGCPLHEGELKDDVVVCPCHGSTFRLDGSIVKGPVTAPQPGASRCASRAERSR